MEKGYDTSEGTPVRFYRSDMLPYRGIQKGRPVETSDASVAEILTMYEDKQTPEKSRKKAGLTETGDYAKCYNRLRRWTVDQHKQWWIEKRCEKAAERLKSHEFDAIYVRTKEEAVQEILKCVTLDTKVGVGGSMTIRQLGILDKLRAQGNAIFDHWIPGLSREQSIEIRKSQMTCDLFLSSSNAITMHGELVNIDGVGNRVNAISFGPKKAIIVASYNKLVENVEEAIKRVRNVASPPNSKRLDMDVPCGKVGICTDCNSPDRACRVMVILERRPMWSDILVILVGEELGY
jgi:hypothetical protein